MSDTRTPGTLRGKLHLAHDSDAVVELTIRNLMDIPGMARGFADDLEAGAYGEVTRAIVIVDGPDGLRTLGWGDSVSSYEAIGILETAKTITFDANFDDD